MVELCLPAKIYVIFSIIQIILDAFNGLYNIAIMKTIISIIMTIILNTFCSVGMSFVSWIIVFIPFLILTASALILVYVFGLKATTGMVHKKPKKVQNNLIYSSEKTQLKPDSNLIYSSNNNISKYIDISFSETPLTNDEVLDVNM
jgi:tetrahydromethanopterin S-methyltransferase subunit E